MFFVESVDVVAMTKELATTVDSLKRVPGERQLNKARLLHLEREIKQGNITTFRWATAKIRGQSDVYRINGQHTSHIFANGSAPVGTVVIERYVCDSLEDVVSLWSRFDATFSSRTKNDVLNTAVDSDDVLKSLPKKLMRTAASALAIVEYGFGYTNKTSHYDKAQVMTKHKDFVVWCCDIFAIGHCSRVGVFVAAFATYRESREQASIFWREVQNGTNPYPTSGSRALQRLLLEYSANSGGGARTGKKTLTWDQFAELSLSAWDNWKFGREVSHLKLSKYGLERFIKIPKGPHALA